MCVRVCAVLCLFVVVRPMISTYDAVYVVCVVVFAFVLL